MMSIFFKYDLLRLLRSKVLVLLLSLIILFVGVAIYNGSQWINFQRRNIDKIITTRALQYDTHIRDGKKYDQQHDTIAFDSPNNPLVIYWGLRGYAYKNPLPAGVFCIGQSDLFPYYSMLVGVDKQYLLIEEEVQNPLNQFVGKLDLSFFVVYLLPVFIILLGFDLISSEKELGILRLLQTQGVSLLIISATKISLRFLLIEITTILSILFWSFVFESRLFSLENLPVMMALLTMVSLYILFWCVLAFLVSSFGRNSVVNGMILITCWILFLFVIPTSLNTLAQRYYPVPSRNEQVLLNRQKENEIESQGSALLEKYLKDHPEHQKKHADTSGCVSWMDWYFELLAKQVELDKALMPGESSIRTATFNQQLFCDKLRFLSPSLLITNHFIQVSETGVYDQLNYAVSLDLFNSKWRTFHRDKIFRRIKFTNEDFEQLPVFAILNVYNGSESLFSNAVGLLLFMSSFILLAYGNFNFKEYHFYVWKKA